MPHEYDLLPQPGTRRKGRLLTFLQVRSCCGVAWRGNTGKGTPTTASAARQTSASEVSLYSPKTRKPTTSDCGNDLAGGGGSVMVVMTP